MKIERWQLAFRENLPLWMKIAYSKKRIRAWYEHHFGDVYVSFSGGKDSVALLHLVRDLYPQVPAVFVDTGLEFPEIKEFVRTFDNVEIVRPALSFRQVLDQHGYPVVSKEVSQKVREVRNTKSEKLRQLRLHGGKDDRGILAHRWRYLIHADFKISEKCCDHLKKSPIKRYEKESGRAPYVGMMASNSFLRLTTYLDHGCNSFSGPRPVSTPIAFWRDEDVWAYIKDQGLEYCSVYDMGYERTGCLFCCFGVHMEKEPNRFQLLHETHPKLWDYCMTDLGLAEVLEVLQIPAQRVQLTFDDLLKAKKDED